MSIFQLDLGWMGAGGIIFVFISCCYSHFPVFTANLELVPRRDYLDSSMHAL